MELTELATFLDFVPTWVWILIAIFVVFVFFGERILWDLEVKFPLRKGIGRAKVEFECGKKRGPRIECTFELEPAYRNQPIEIDLNGHHVFTVPAEKNISGRFRLVHAIEIAKPEEGDEVSVRIGADTVFSGLLVLD